MVRKTIFSATPPQFRRACPLAYLGRPTGVGDMKAQYSVELLRESRDGVIAASILAQETDLDAAHAMYKFCTRQFSNCVILLADRARILARSDCP